VRRDEEEEDVYMTYVFLVSHKSAGCGDFGVVRRDT
jgi:hypothetical protein